MCGWVRVVYFLILPIAVYNRPSGAISIHLCGACFIAVCCLYVMITHMHTKPHRSLADKMN